MTNTEGAVDIVIAGMKGDVVITAMRDGQVKLRVLTLFFKQMKILT